MMAARSESFDYVIIGAGSAGCTLANRLSADADVRVLLLEAGGWDRHPFVKLPLGWGKVLLNRIYDWGYDGEPQDTMAGRRIECARGKVIGGSSSINGLIYIRGQPEDYDHWAQLGNRGWSWDDCLPFFRAAERWEGEGSDVRGKDGPLFTSRIDRSPASPGRSTSRGGPSTGMRRAFTGCPCAGRGRAGCRAG